MTSRTAPARYAGPLRGAVCAAVLVLLSGPAGAGLPADLLAGVRALDLGEEAYVLGRALEPDQREALAGTEQADAYPGTVKYCRDDLCVVVTADAGIVLALYRRIEEPSVAQVRAMLGRLMVIHGEPTAEAHGELVYWAYGPQGRIDGATWEADRGVGELEVLATVKIRVEGGFAAAGVDEGTDPPGTTYYIITSDRLLEAFTAQH